MKRSEILHYDLLSVAEVWLDLNVKEINLRSSDVFGYDRSDYGELIDKCQETLLTLVWEYVEALREENRHEKNECLTNTPNQKIS